MVNFNYVIVDANRNEIFCFKRDRKLDSNEQQELIALFAEMFPQHAAKAAEVVEFIDHSFPDEAM